MLRRIATLRTDAAGKLIQTEDLDPESRFVISVDTKPQSAYAMESREKVAEWVNNCVLGDIRTLHYGIKSADRGLTSSDGRRFGGGNFLLASACCSAMEYVAWIRFGEADAVTNIRRYCAAYLNSIDTRYGKFIELIWRSFRNGLVHGWWPQCPRLRGEPATRFRMGVGISADDLHLEIDPNLERPSFSINASRFFADFERSVDEGFLPWVLRESDDGVLERAAPALLEISAADRVGFRQFDEIRKTYESGRKRLMGRSAQGSESDTSNSCG
ncbi:MAG: hypothetical protein HYR85_07590 [Planctomycetes bacterium]|nr:hypothetical protein [Planctomycetota bacterium]